MANSTIIPIEDSNLGQSLLKPTDLKQFSKKLHTSAKNGDTKILLEISKKFYSRKPDCLQNPETNKWGQDDVSKSLQIDNEYDQNIIHVAAEHGHLDFIKKVFELFGEKTCEATDPDFRDCDDWTPLLLAVHRGAWQTPIF